MVLHLHTDWRLTEVINPGAAAHDFVRRHG